MITVYEKDFLDCKFETNLRHITMQGKTKTILNQCKFLDPKSKQANISISECSNFPEELVQNASSVNTQDNCARLYSELDCRGHYIEMSPRAPSHNRLKH